jgi:hypothetical protein
MIAITISHTPGSVPQALGRGYYTFVLLRIFSILPLLSKFLVDPLENLRFSQDSGCSQRVSGNIILQITFQNA